MTKVQILHNSSITQTWTRWELVFRTMVFKAGHNVVWDQEKQSCYCYFSASQKFPTNSVCSKIQFCVWIIKKFVNHIAELLRYIRHTNQLNAKNRFEQNKTNYKSQIPNRRIRPNRMYITSSFKSVLSKSVIYIYLIPL